MDLAAPCCPLAHPPQLKKTCIPPPPNHPHQKYPTSILYSPMPPFSSDLICLLLTIILTSLPPNPILHTCKKNCILHIAALHSQLQGSCCYYTLSLTHTLSSLHTHTHTQWQYTLQYMLQPAAAYTLTITFARVYYSI